jgi:hypothetical protein
MTDMLLQAEYTKAASRTVQVITNVRIPSEGNELKARLPLQVEMGISYPFASTARS